MPTVLESDSDVERAPSPHDGCTLESQLDSVVNSLRSVRRQVIETKAALRAKDETIRTLGEELSSSNRRAQLLDNLYLEACSSADGYRNDWAHELHRADQLATFLASAGITRSPSPYESQLPSWKPSPSRKRRRHVKEEEPVQSDDEVDVKKEPSCSHHAV